MEIWAIILVVVIIWSISSKKKAIKETLQTPDSDNEITEDRLHEIQAEFESGLNDSFLPDAISGNEIYIFRELMSGWFLTIAATNRYDETLSQKIRCDWVDYMTALKDRSTYNYLSLETEDEEESKEYRDSHVLASRKAFAIEDAFAKMIDDKAVRELKKIRSMSSFDFDESGHLMKGK